MGIDEWASYNLSIAQTYTFEGTIPAGAIYVTPVIATSGPGTSITIDNVSLTGLAEALPVINDPDYNDDDAVNLIDLSYLAGVWQQTSSTYNLSGEELIDIEDLQTFAAAWLRTSPYLGYNLVWSDEFNTSGDTYLGLRNIVHFCRRGVLCFFSLFDHNPMISRTFSDRVYSLYAYQLQQPKSEGEA